MIFSEFSFEFFNLNNCRILILISGSLYLIMLRIRGPINSKILPVFTLNNNTYSYYYVETRGMDERTIHGGKKVTKCNYYPNQGYQANISNIKLNIIFGVFPFFCFL
jgi:hypothetical protein